MKKFLIVICGVFMVVSAFAVGENVPTSKSYVDAEIAKKQDKISANDGTAQVLTNTGTAGEYGTKNIYDSTGSYTAQSDALIDAVTMNTAVQNAIDSEFQCVEYNPNDPTDCWLMDVRGQTAHQTKNLLDPSFMDNSSYDTVTVYGVDTPRAKILPTEPNKTYTLSATLTYNGTYYYYLRYILPDGSTGYTTGCGSYMWTNYNGEQNGTKRKSCSFTTQENATYIVYFATSQSQQQTRLTLSEYQMEEGSVATAYEPYGNVYLPAGN